VQQARGAVLLSAEHSTVDGTLIEAWASLQTFKRKDGKDQKPPDDPGNPTVDFHGEKRSNETHQSTTDPEAKLYRKGNSQPAKLYFSGHALMENRNGLCVDFAVAQSDGYAERAQALAMLDRQRGNRIRPRTLGADKAYDTADFIADLRARGITPHVAQNQSKRRSASGRRPPPRQAPSSAAC